MNNDLISREALRNEVDSWGCNDYDKHDFLEAIDNAPTIENTSRPQGEWITVWRDDLDAMSKRGWRCSCCSWVTSYGTPRFCMNCGAEMKDGAK